MLFNLLSIFLDVISFRELVGSRVKNDAALVFVGVFLVLVRDAELLFGWFKLLAVFIPLFLLLYYLKF